MKNPLIARMIWFNLQLIENKSLNFGNVYWCLSKKEGIKKKFERKKVKLVHASCKVGFSSTWKIFKHCKLFEHHSTLFNKNTYYILLLQQQLSQYTSISWLCVCVYASILRIYSKSTMPCHTMLYITSWENEHSSAKLDPSYGLLPAKRKTLNLFSSHIASSSQTQQQQLSSLAQR